ncbi:AP2 domain transcription factor AP2XII-2 [Besnoitia besnoiti]|uniref:AP2 domain transcription factor AP2XII-2 n=1 Tax=Besnoitia besnoiti TaxID=94643 RepID=A0A2A9MM61_BESBE|nr:AP2 domain transcription factor AP2XII-2 [Besnoitia besnoiti]PFH38384.1 AP2 domain transcription factor AP2XII-2 [Besnoitia besnoiti]
MAHSNIHMPSTCLPGDGRSAISSRCPPCFPKHSPVPDGLKQKLNFPGLLSQAAVGPSQTTAAFDVFASGELAAPGNGLPGVQPASPSRCTTTASVALLPAFPVNMPLTTCATAPGDALKTQAHLHSTVEDEAIPASIRREIPQIVVRRGDAPTDALMRIPANQSAESYFRASREYSDFAGASAVREAAMANFPRPHVTSVPAATNLALLTQQPDSAASCASPPLPGGPADAPTAPMGAEIRVGASTESLQQLLSKHPQQARLLAAVLQRDGQSGSAPGALSRHLWAVAAAAAVRASPGLVQQQLRLRSQLLTRMALERCAQGEAPRCASPASKETLPASRVGNEGSVRVGSAPQNSQALQKQKECLAQSEARLQRPEILAVLHNRSTATFRFVLRALAVLAECCPRWAATAPAPAAAPLKSAHRTGAQLVGGEVILDRAAVPGDSSTGRCGSQVFRGQGEAEASGAAPSSYRWHWLHVVSFADKPELLTVYSSILAPLVSFASCCLPQAYPADNAASLSARTKERQALCGSNSALVLLQVLRELDDLRSLHDPLFLSSGIYSLQLLGQQPLGAVPHLGVCGEGCRAAMSAEGVCGLGLLRQSPLFPSFLEAAKALLAWPAPAVAAAAASLPQSSLQINRERATVEHCDSASFVCRECRQRTAAAASQGSASSANDAEKVSLVAAARGLAECILKHVDLNALDGSELLALLRLSEHLKPSLEAAVEDRAPVAKANSLVALASREGEAAFAVANGVQSCSVSTKTAMESQQDDACEAFVSLNKRGGDADRTQSQTHDSPEGVRNGKGEAISHGNGDGSTQGSQESVSEWTVSSRRHSESSTGSGQTVGAISSTDTDSAAESCLHSQGVAGSESPHASVICGSSVQPQEQPPAHTLLCFSPLFSFKDNGAASSSDLASCSPFSTEKLVTRAAPQPLSAVEKLLAGPDSVVDLQEPLPDSPVSCSLSNLLCPGPGADDGSARASATAKERACAADGPEAAPVYEGLYPSSSFGYSFSRLSSQEPPDFAAAELGVASGFAPVPLEESALSGVWAVHESVGLRDLPVLSGGLAEGAGAQAAVGGVQAVGKTGSRRRSARRQGATRHSEKRPEKLARMPAAQGAARAHDAQSKKRDYGVASGGSCDEFLAATCGGAGVRGKRAKTQTPVAEVEQPTSQAWSDAPEASSSLPDLLSRGGSANLVSASPATQACQDEKASGRNAAGAAGARRPVGAGASRGPVASTSSSVRSAVKGIYFDSYKKLWRVQWNSSGSSGGGSGGAGRRVSRSFSCARLGFEAAKARAIAWMLSGGHVGDGALSPNGGARGGSPGSCAGAGGDGVSDATSDGGSGASQATPELLEREEKERLLFSDPRLFLERIEAFYIKNRLYGLQCSGNSASASSQAGAEDSSQGSGESGGTGHRRGNGGSGGLRIVSVLSLDDMLAILKGTKRGMGDDASEHAETEAETEEEGTRVGEESESLCDAGACETPPRHAPFPLGGGSQGNQTDSQPSRKKQKRGKAAPAAAGATRSLVASPVTSPFVPGLSEEMEKHLFRLLPSLAPATARIDAGLQACHPLDGDVERTLSNALAAAAVGLEAADSVASLGVIPEVNDAHMQVVPSLSG